MMYEDVLRERKNQNLLLVNLQVRGREEKKRVGREGREEVGEGGREGKWERERGREEDKM